MYYRNSLYTDIIFSSVNVVLHMICSLLLSHIYKHGIGSKIQPLYLVNLSVTELVRNFYFLVGKSILVADGVGNDIPKIPEKEWAIRWIINVCTKSINILAMFLITGDRLALALLGIRYNNIVTVSRVKVAIICSWSFCLLLAPSIFALLYIVYGAEEVKKTCEHEGFYIFPVIHVLFFVFAVTTYIIMFIAFVRSRRRSSVSQHSVLYLFAHSKFYAAVLLMASFLLLMVIPSIVFFSMVESDTLTDSSRYILIVLTCLSDTFDGIIYFIFYPPVRQLIRKFFHQCNHQQDVREKQSRVFHLIPTDSVQNNRVSRSITEEMSI